MSNICLSGSQVRAVIGEAKQNLLVFLITELSILYEKNFHGLVPFIDKYVRLYQKTW